MKQIYYAIQSILHGRGSNVTKVISLSLGLTIGILLFSQIAFELNYEKCYPDADRLVLVRGGFFQELMDTPKMLLHASVAELVHLVNQSLKEVTVMGSPGRGRHQTLRGLLRRRRPVRHRSAGWHAGICRSCHL